ncbi:MAG: DNA-entry nuclease [Ruminococcaceae bacterium]|nr:DNA-entry nuclease [Oscillospiraceae bacterium]
MWLLALLVTFCIVFTSCASGKPVLNENTLESQDIVQSVGTNSESTGSSVIVNKDEIIETEKQEKQEYVFDISDVKPYSGQPSFVINGNNPVFAKNEITKKAYEFYSPLDSLGRCGYAIACLGKETMPADGEKRGDIQKIKPTGWINNAYDSDVVPGRYVYNRCHLIGWQLSAENDNRQNLITGTRDMNNKGMLPFENMVADYINETGNHVMYRVTPIFEGNNLVASGVHIEAYSVEDDGYGVYFNVFVYNVQPGIEIDYATGENRLAYAPPVEDNGDGEGDEGGDSSGSGENTGGGDSSGSDENTGDGNSTGNEGNTGEGDSSGSGENTGDGNDTGNEGNTGDGDSSADQPEYKYIANKSTKKIHYPHCSAVNNMSEKNKLCHNGPISELLNDGYSACKTCNPQ